MEWNDRIENLPVSPSWFLAAYDQFWSNSVLTYESYSVRYFPTNIIFAISARRLCPKFDTISISARWNIWQILSQIGQRVQELWCLQKTQRTPTDFGHINVIIPPLLGIQIRPNQFHITADHGTNLKIPLQYKVYMTKIWTSLPRDKVVFFYASILFNETNQLVKSAYRNSNFLSLMLL